MTILSKDGEWKWEKGEWVERNPTTARSASTAAPVGESLNDIINTIPNMRARMVVATIAGVTRSLKKLLFVLGLRTPSHQLGAIAVVLVVAHILVSDARESSILPSWLGLGE